MLCRWSDTIHALFGSCDSHRLSFSAALRPQTTAKAVGPCSLTCQSNPAQGLLLLVVFCVVGGFHGPMVGSAAGNDGDGVRGTAHYLDGTQLHTPSMAFRHLPPNSARTGYATEG